MLLRVVDAVVGDESLEAAVVVAGKPVDAETAERGSYGSKTGGIDIRLAANVVDGTEIVPHALPRVVA